MAYFWCSLLCCCMKPCKLSDKICNCIPISIEVTHKTGLIKQIISLNTIEEYNPIILFRIQNPWFTLSPCEHFQIHVEIRLSVSSCRVKATEALEQP